MQEAERGLGRGVQGAVGAVPVGAYLFQQAERADHVGVDEFARAMNGPVHVAFGSEVQHGTGAVLQQRLAHGIAVGDVGMHQRGLA